MEIALRCAARSDVGLVRLNNQDSGYAGAHLLVVADGMGGHAGGDVASAITVGALMHLDTTTHEPDAALAELAQAIDDARHDLVDRSTKDPKLSGMGTTVTALLVVDGKLVMAHLGDSRAYLLRDGELQQVTTDHTFVQHLVDTGRISPQEAETHPQRNVVMRVLGDFDVDLTPDVSIREAKPGDRWMLCSDGLSGFLSAETMRRTLIDLPGIEECAQDLLDQALDAGSTDNVTVVIADVVELGDDDELWDEHVVVGAAAIEEAPPASAGDTPSTDGAGPPPPTPENDSEQGDPDDAQDAPPRRRPWLLPVVIAVVIGLLGTGGWLGYRWTQSQYYLGISDGNVAVFQGINASAGPLRLSHVIERTSTSVADLPATYAATLSRTTPTESLDEARARARKMAQEAARNTAGKGTDTADEDSSASSGLSTATLGSV